MSTKTISVFAALALALPAAGCGGGDSREMADPLEQGNAGTDIVNQVQGGGSPEVIPPGALPGPSGAAVLRNDAGNEAALQ
jgi:hypothetical protein